MMQKLKSDCLKILIWNILSFVVISTISCNNNEFSVNEAIIAEFEANVVDTISEQDKCGYLFKSKMDLNITLNNERYSPSSFSRDYILFKSTWRYKNDTINIFGTDIRPDNVIGFELNIIENDIEVYAYSKTHILMSNLALDTIGPTYNAILIPSDNSKVVISKLPKDKDDTIYGYLEFETDEFYTLEKGSIEKYIVNERIRMKPKFYFKAKGCKE